MTIKQIEYFIKTCEKGNITLAAEELYASRSAVSKAIHELEEEFGVRLLERSKSGVVPTREGEQVLRQAVSMQSGYEYLRKTLESMNIVHEKVIRVALTRSCSTVFYEKFLLPFIEKNPEIRFTIHEYNALDAFGRMDSGEYDFAMAPSVLDIDRFERVFLYNNRTCLVVPKDDERFAEKESISIEDIADIPLAFATASVPIESTLKNALEPLGRSCNVALKTSDFNMIVDMMRRGLVYPIISEELAKTLTDVKLFLLPIRKYMTLTSVLAWKKAPMYPGYIQDFINFATQITRQSIGR
ncbi:MAG: LysR family transcriptional regulator [Firmicutes bacterium]|nr:LysR family transcriptional regulator [Bacillota bacterium]MBQ5415105.1 LysR family transcriptional regulator [Bacillota bacterium]